MQTEDRNSHQRSALSPVCSQAERSLSFLPWPSQPPSTFSSSSGTPWPSAHVSLTLAGVSSDRDGWLILPEILKALLHDQEISHPLPRNAQVQASSLYPIQPTCKWSCFCWDRSTAASHALSGKKQTNRFFKKFGNSKS